MLLTAENMVERPENIHFFPHNSRFLRADSRQKPADLQKMIPKSCEKPSQSDDLPAISVCAPHAVV